MKQIILLMLAIFVGVNFCQAQDTQTAKTTIEAGWGDLNYAIPDAPAFKILGTSPSNIMRPSVVRDVALQVGNYFQTNGATIPQNLAVEISPSAFNPHVNLQQFRKNRFWYTSAISLGTKVNADKSYALGLGFKVRLWDNQDLRLNDILIQKFDEFGKLDVNAYDQAWREVAHNLVTRSNNTRKFQECLIEVQTALSDSTNKEHNDILNQVNTIISRSFDVNKISKLRDSIKTLSWNKSIADLGVAALFNSKDSLIRNIKPFTKLGLWGTVGLPIGHEGQILLGVNGQLRDTVSSRLGARMLSLGSRFYYGSNQFKGFAEANTTFDNIEKNTYKASVGIETTFFGGLWFDFSLGLSKQSNTKFAFTPGFNLFFANGEKKQSGS